MKRRAMCFAILCTALSFGAWPSAGQTVKGLHGDAAPSIEAEKLVGRWEGQFYCDADMNGRMVLTIKQTGGQLSGIFEFKASGGPQQGSYNVVGKSGSGAAFQLDFASWITQPEGANAASLRGYIERGILFDRIKGKLSPCSHGDFGAEFRPPYVSPPPPVAKNYWDAKGPAWVKAIRAKIQDFVQKRVDNQNWWNALGNEVISGHVDGPTKNSLYAEYQQARASVAAFALLDELASGPKHFPAGIGRALLLFDRATASEWPNETKLLVYKACQKQVADVLRPMLAEVGALAASRPASLGNLMRARAAFAPIESYRISLERAFGTIDQENLLAPMSALESNPAIGDEFRAALAQARQKPKPRNEIETVIWNALGPQGAPSRLDPIATEGRKLASWAEVVVENHDSEENGLEPSANDIAIWAHELTETENAKLAAKRCAPGTTVYDPLAMSQCQEGEQEYRLTKVTKTDCVEETPGLQYLCHFHQNYKIVSFRTGEPIQGGIAYISQLPFGNTDTASSARFVRNVVGGGWVGSR